MLTNKLPDPKVSSTPIEVELTAPEVIAALQDALRKVSPFGEVHLIIEHGHIRFIRTIRSEAVERKRG